MGNSASSGEKRLQLETLFRMVLQNDLPSASAIIMQNPRLLCASLDSDLGQNVVHAAVGNNEALALLLSYCSNISR